MTLSEFDCTNFYILIKKFNCILFLGTAVITKDKAYLWTDSRYHIEASRVLDENWTLMRVGIKHINRNRRCSKIKKMVDNSNFTPL